LNAAIETKEFLLEPADNKVLANLCGQFNEHLKQIEERLGVHISNRGNYFRVVGTSNASDQSARVIRQLYALAEQEHLDSQHVHMCLQESAMTDTEVEAEQPAPTEASKSEGVIHTPRSRIKSRGMNQASYVQNLRSQDLCFGIGPAGTGKTYLAVATAVEALDKEEVRRIVLVRPAVEAGERLGFLPGDMSQKVDPYLRPMYDALYEMLGFDRVGRLIEKNIIEIAPLAFMRGRSLNESFIILDEAQNTTAEQMKMFLTRMGYGSRAVVTGDTTQIDLPRQQTSGLKHVLGILQGVSGVSFDFFTSKDVIRHPLVQRIVDAYDSKDKESGGDGGQ